MRTRNSDRAYPISAASLSEKITIDVSASDATPLLRDGQGARVFRVDDGRPGANDRSTVELIDLVLSGGDIAGDGGLIHNAELLRLTGVELRESGATGNGGGVFSREELFVSDAHFEGLTAKHGGAVRVEARYEIIDSVFAANHALETGGGLSTAATGTPIWNGNRFERNTAKQGGAAYLGGNAIHVSADNVVDRNRAVEGGAIYSPAANQQRISHLTATWNTAQVNGGAVYVFGLSTVEGSHFAENRADGDGGAIYASAQWTLRDTQLLSNHAGGTGGGIHQSSGSPRVERLIVRDNTAAAGGGLYYRCNRGGAPTIQESLFDGNMADDGGGIYAHLTQCGIGLRNVTISNNTATTNGGGIYFGAGDPWGGTPKLTQVTLSGNEAGVQGGAIYTAFALSTLDMDASTIVHNRAGTRVPSPSAGGGLCGGGWFRANRSIFGHNHSIQPDQTEALNDWCAGLWFEEVRHNLIQSLATQPTGGTGNIVGVDPQLSPLGDHGGLLPTHVPLPGSPVIDTGYLLAGLEEFDQRGAPFLRISNGNPDTPARQDIGATEFQTNSPPTADAGGDRQTRVGESTTLVGSASTDFEGDPLTFLWQVLSGPAGATLTPIDQPITQFFADTAGTYQVELSVSDGFNSGTDTIEITVRENQAPVADASRSDATGEVGLPVLLDGSASTDPDGDPLQYVWTSLAHPAGAEPSIEPVEGNEGVSFFVPARPGRYVFSLTVDDGLLSSGPTEVTIEVAGDDPSWHNEALPLDVNADGQVGPLDALLIINELDRREYSDPLTGELLGSRPPGVPFLDTTGDQRIAPLDALLVINALPSTSTVVSSSNTVSSTQWSRLATAATMGLPATCPDAETLACLDDRAGLRNEKLVRRR